MTKDLTDGLVLDLDIETLQDYSGNGNDGTATGTTLTTDKDGRYNKARSFNGSSDNINVGTLGNFGQLISSGVTVSVWVKSSDTLNKMYIFGVVNDGGTTIFDLALNTNSSELFAAGNILGYIRDEDGWDIGAAVQSNTGVTDGNWHHVAAVYNGAGQSVTFYLDGVLQTTTYGLQQLADNTGNLGYDLKLGARNIRGGLANFFTGSMGNVKFWDRELDATEVQQDYADIKHNYQGLFDGLVAGYDFKGDAKDFSGNGNDGTVTGATLTTDHLGISNSAYLFDGNDYIEASYQFSSATTYSLVAWFKTSNTGAFQSIISVKSGTPLIQLYIDNANYLTWNIRDSSSNQAILTSASTVTDGDWHFVVATNDGSSQNLYLDGVLIDSDSVSQNAITIAYNVGIGSKNDAGTYKEFFDGTITRPLIYNKILPSDKVKALYNLTKSGYIYPYPQQRQGGITE